MSVEGRPRGRFAWVIAIGYLGIFGSVRASVAPSVDVNGRQIETQRIMGPKWIPNRGQVDPHVLFYANTFAGTIAMLGDGRLIYTLRHEGGSRRLRAGVVNMSDSRASEVKLWSVVEELEGGKVRPAPLQQTNTLVNWIRGAESRQWKAGLPTYTTLDLGEVWPRVQVQLRVNDTDVERVFTVLPRGRVNSIRLRLDGVSDLRVARDGSLVGQTELGPIRWSAPIAYQVVANVHRPVPVRYRVLSGERVTFRTGRYDPSRPLIIDPFLSATFVGGSNYDAAFAIARATVPGDGIFFFVAGETVSPVFPVTSWSAGFQGTLAGGRDAFVARIAGTSPSPLNRVTFFGGEGNDTAWALATDGDPASYVYVAGETASLLLPATASGAQSTYGGGSKDGFIARFSADLSSVVATYLGGSARDVVQALAVSGSSVFVAGATNSNSFPGSAGGGQPSRAGGFDGFVGKLAADLSSVVQSTYVGGTSDDFLTGLAISGADAFVAGYTESSDFPATASGAQSTHAGAIDGVLTVMPATLTSPPSQSTYFGGTGYEYLRALVLNGTVLYAAGQTDSSSLPGVSGKFQDSYGGGPTEGFVLRVDQTLTSGLMATFVGGSADDWFNAIDVVGSTVVAVGLTGSPTLPGSINALQPVPGGNMDGLVAALSDDLTTGVTSFFGGSEMDELYGAKGFTDTAGLPRVGIAGGSESNDVPALDSAAQPVHQGDGDGLVAELPVPPTFECPQFAVAGCLAPVKASVTVQDRTLGGGDPDARDKFVWTWKGTATSGSYHDFGNPMIVGGRTDYLFCVYDSNGLVDQLKVALRVKRGGICGGSGQTCWKKVPKRGTQTGYMFRDPTLAQYGVARILLRRSPTGVGKDVIKVSAKGATLGLPGPTNSSQYFLVDNTFRVQLFRSDGSRCWEATWPATAVRKNTTTSFRASCGGTGQPPC